MPSAPPPPPLDYLDSSGGDALPPRPQPSRGPSRPVLRGLVVAGGVVALGAAGYGAWAAYSFFQTGSQPAQALPASTIGYVSIDLDPSGGQKIAAVRTLNKFPAFKDEVGITSSDDLREKLFDAVQGSGECTGLDYDRDVEPWLGDRAAVAAVDTGASDPVPVVVVQVTDDAKAERGLTALRGCGGGSTKLAWHVDGDWALLAETQATADQVAQDAAGDSLADDSDFQHWTSETGDAGVVSMYAAPAAGTYLADHLDQLASFPMGLTSSPPIPDGIKDQLRDFKGAAATIRFDDGGVELAVASDSHLAQGALLGGGGSAGTLVETLPADTGAALGIGFQDGWLQSLLTQASSYTGQSARQLEAGLEQVTGLSLPDDIETLTGQAVAVSVGSGADPSALLGGDPSTVPVAVKVQGDPDDIEAVLTKVTSRLAALGLPADVLGTDSARGAIAIGPDPAYRAEVAKDGGLGDSAVFRDVVPDADRASSILFLDVDRFDATIRGLTGGDSELADNLKPLSGLGLAAWTDGDASHAVLRISTN